MTGVLLTHIDLGVVLCLMFLTLVVVWLAIGLVRHVSYFVMKWWPHGSHH